MGVDQGHRPTERVAARVGGGGDLAAEDGVGQLERDRDGLLGEGFDSLGKAGVQLVDRGIPIDLRCAARTASVEPQEIRKFTDLRFALLLMVWATTWPTAVAAQPTPVLPSPLSLGDVIRLAGERRDEIHAARARIRAGEARPTIVSALQDPMISPSLDHLPFMLGGADVSVTIEQQIPLSGIRRSRRTAALADVDRLRAEANRTTLDVGIQAANAFLMLQERRRTQALVAEQIGFARDVVTAANARYSSGTAPQSDVLRAEVEMEWSRDIKRDVLNALFDRLEETDGMRVPVRRGNWQAAERLKP